MISVPEDINGIDIVFGNIKHLPKKEDIPEKYYESSNDLHNFVNAWFYRGLKKFDGKPKEGVDGGKALAVIRAALVSFEPKHERKIAGCAYLLDQWFDFDGEYLSETINQRDEA